MCHEFKLVVVSCDEHFSQTFLGDMSDEMHSLDVFHSLMIADGHSEEQFIVLTAVEGASGDIEVEFLCHHRSLIVDGDILLEDAASHMTLMADMEEFATESVADIHHSGGFHSRNFEFLDDVSSCLCLQLSLEQVFLTYKVGLEMAQFLECTFVTLLHCLFHLLIVHRLLAFEELESHICRTEVARHAHEVGFLSPVAIYDVVLVGLTDTGDTDGESCV